MSICDICNRNPLIGNHVSFSQRHVKRRWNNNVQKRRVVVDGQPRRVHVCTNCLKTMTKTKG